MTLKRQEVIARVQGVTTRRLDAWIERGWVSPARDEHDLAFDEIDVARIDLVRQLRDELEIDRESMPVLLSLMDQVYSLRRELRCMLKAVEDQPSEVRETIIARVKLHRD